MASAQPQQMTMPPAAETALAVVDDGLPPPTKAQVHYWRELCGALTLAGTAGLRDEQWPEELAPSKPTLQALVERDILVRRRRAWHLRRRWYARLCVLRERAVPTPALTLVDRPGPNLPTYAELESWETLCRWLDGQPHRQARLPFVGGEELGVASELPILQLKGMRRYRLVRHTAICEWALSPTWKQRLQALWKGVAKLERETCAPQPSPTAPRSLVAGIDTWHLNWLVAEPLPARLRHQLDDLPERAREEETEVDTPWSYDGAPLRLYQHGTRPESGGGVSWSYVLVNASLRLLIRKAPLGGIIAQARLGSECLWRLTDRGALDQLHRLVCRMWGLSQRISGHAQQERQGHWQVSQVHLCHDVAHAPLVLDQLDRVVSRSRTQAIYEAARHDVERLRHDLTHDDDDTLLEAGLGVDWDAAFADEDELLGWDQEPDGPEQPVQEPEPAHERSATVYRWGQRLSGISWSVGGAISFVAYDKRLYGRLSQRQHMEPIWQASGWQPEEGVTRYEARLRREAIHELRLPRVERACLDDPWEFLEHKQDVFAAVVGRVEECPEATNVAWIRLVVPDEHDTNRSRWPTDPLWQVVQQAPFTAVPAPVRRLIRQAQRAQEVHKLDEQSYGLLVSRTAALHPEGGPWDVSMAFRETVDALQRLAERPHKDFGELVWERRRQRGLPLPPSDKLLPFRPRRSLVDEIIDPLLNREPHDDQEHARQRALLAERRMEEALLALEEAQQQGAPERVLVALDQVFLQETQAYAAASAAIRNQAAET